MSVHEQKVYELINASIVDKVMYKYFMLPKEIHNYASKLNLSKKLSNDDRSGMIMEARALTHEGKVLYVQLFNPGNNGQSFVIIIQDNWMLQMCRNLSANNAWVIDSTFRTNQFRLSLYIVVAPHSQGIRIPLW
jgi:hypothetical protein